MCGICGIINFDGAQVEEQDLKKMMASMKHRGPDDEGIFIQDNLGLGFVRLSIIDLSSAGHQPMVSADSRYILVFNGEIFNYIELRKELMAEGVAFHTKTDSEVLLNAYISWGEACLHKFNGMWAFAIYDRKQKSVFVSRDRYGIKPFYYWSDDRQFIFASEIPPILSILENKPKANNQAIFDYLVFNRTDQTESTFFKGIKKLQHGHNISIELNQTTGNNPKFTTRKWYDLRTQVKNSSDFSSPGEFYELFSSSVGLRLRSDVPVGVCLSGGLDSSGIVSVILNDYRKDDINTFSAVYKSGQFGDETEFINEYTGKLKNMFYVFPDSDSLLNDIKKYVQVQAEPIPDLGPYAQFKVMQLAEKKVVVTLDGQGADEMLGGYHYFFGFLFKDLLIHGRFMRLIKEIYHYLINHTSTYGLRVCAYLILPERFRKRISEGQKKYLNPVFIKKNHSSKAISGDLYGADSLQEALINHFEYKLEHLLKWEDLNSMNFSIEARVPFLDHRLVEKMLFQKDEVVIYKGMTKNILRESMKGIMPEKIRSRKDKIGFGTPQDEWYREPGFQKIFTDIFNSESFAERGIVDHNKVIEMYKEFVKGNRNVTREIWKLLHLELWFREFID